MRTYATLILALLVLQAALGQKNDYNWVFGESTRMSFHQKDSLKITFLKNCYWVENYSSISNEEGLLLFYIGGNPVVCSTNTMTVHFGWVYDSIGAIVQHSDSLYTSLGTTQGVVFLPGYNDEDSLIYLFQCYQNLGGVPSNLKGLYYSVIPICPVSPRCWGMRK